MDDANRASILTLLWGVLMGAFGVGLALSGSLGATALTFVLIVLAIIFVLTKLIPSVSLVYVIGLIIGALLVIFLPALSPASLAPVQLILVLSVLWLLGR